MIPDIGERKMKRNRIIAMLLGTALLVCGCQQTPKATDEEKKIEAEKNKTKTEEKEYQGKLDLISPAAEKGRLHFYYRKGEWYAVLGRSKERRDTGCRGSECKSWIYRKRQDKSNV